MPPQPSATYPPAAGAGLSDRNATTSEPSGMNSSPSAAAGVTKCCVVCGSDSVSCTLPSEGRSPYSDEPPKVAPVQTTPPATIGELPPLLACQRVWNAVDESMDTAVRPSRQGTYTVLPATAMPPKAASDERSHTCALAFSPPPGFELLGSAD